ncbi:16S rRNA (cytosine(967)-C(5))-methyltransferase RsmB [Paenalcaligenes niemegkensis]|uniref:16S rRNA (cytosine(967)-C(5))-methyltransferase RsmB n=1 Tax=Paenalcaligenes niemegkensis TaxID=2895469 RepID=UPI001EE80BFB|nr:16S rRNA (cytosine(967)-C(5))-methyltransferase RsmB [Paenalcaligenes niemegkensis]MCQ9615598.1 16S rRNA (cytosine(967)-C(5))-methyltransferase RsmB [Paenalcaligenes niemegkensis]
MLQFPPNTLLFSKHPVSSSTPTLAPSLSDTLLASSRHIQGVLSGKSLTECLAATPDSLRASSQSVSFHALRRLGLARQLRQMMVPRKPQSAWFDALLLVSLALVDTAAQAQDGPEFFQDRPDVPLYAVHTVVDQAVSAADSQIALRPYKALLNGTLRRFLREREALLAVAMNTQEAKWNHPQWWIRRLKKAYPTQFEEILAVSNEPGPLTLRVNLRRCSVQRMLALLEQTGIQAWSPGGAAVILAQAQPVTSLPGFNEGWWSVQDYSAQQAGYLLPIADGMRVLDACAAPGGKTAHLLEQADVSMLALDSDPQRLTRVNDTLQRLGLWSDNVQTVAADAVDLDSWWDGEGFDAILADVPCTASGIVRRHPDIRWLRRESDILATAALQQEITDALWRTLKPGGHMLYATCSLFPQEGAVQANAFGYRHPDAQCLEAPGQILPKPNRAGQSSGDGFFYALFRKVT